MDSFMEWLGVASAGFVGTGAALLALRSLSNTIVGHWLAKGLIRYTAKVETDHLKTRVAIERLDRQRSDYIARLTERIARCNLMLLSPVSTSGAPPGAGPELLALQFYGKVWREAHEIAGDTVSGVHLFSESEPLGPLVMEWTSDIVRRANSFLDAITSTVATQSYWDSEVRERKQAMESIRIDHLCGKQSLEALLARCRFYTGA